MCIVDPPYRQTLGPLATIGRRTGVVKVFGFKFSGFAAWALWRSIYLSLKATLHSSPRARAPVGLREDFMLSTLPRLFTQAFSAAEKEISVLETLHAEVRATLRRLPAQDAGLTRLLADTYGYAVFSSVGKATALVGGAFGKGEVFVAGELVGYAGVAQLTVGAQLGGQTFAEVVAFESKEALDRFKQGKGALAANASAVLVKAGAAASARFERGAAVFVHAEGGLSLELAVGVQKFFFRPAVLGRGKPAAAPRRHAAGGKATKRPSSTAGGKRLAGKAKPAAGKRPSAKSR